MNRLRVGKKYIFILCHIKKRKIGIWFALRPDDRIISDRAANTPRAHPWHHLPKGCTKGRHRCTSWCNTSRRLISRQKRATVSTKYLKWKSVATNWACKFIIIILQETFMCKVFSSWTISSAGYFVKVNLKLLLLKAARWKYEKSVDGRRDDLRLSENDWLDKKNKTTFCRTRCELIRNNADDSVFATSRMNIRFSRKYAIATLR